MKTDRWQKIEDIFHTALAQSPTQRVTYLNQACEEDSTLRKEIESLLAFSEEAQDIEFLKNSPILRQTAIWSLEALIGQIIDSKYRIEKQLGQGGMGAVYLATHLGTGRMVAIKIIAPQYMGYTEFVERFKREAEATGRLRHPNVINVTDFGFSTLGSDQLAYLVMEYLNGSTLSDLLKEKGQLPLDLVVDIIEQICLAVEEAHKIGIIHRDLKPDNIWLEPNGRGSYNVKVLDFGLAKLRDVPTSFQNMQLPLLERLKLIEETPNQISLVSGINSKNSKNSDEQTTLRQYINSSDSTAQVTHGNIDPKTVPVWLTRGGMVLGTPLYMSPEQCHGKPLDNRSDVYSVGIMTYQMLTGETPFNGDFHQLVDKHTNMPAPLIKEKRKDLPETINKSVMMALAKNPLDRPKSMIAFATALKANAQTEISLIRQAISIYSNNFLRFLSMSVLAYLPLILITLTAFLWIVIPNWKPLSAEKETSDHIIKFIAGLGVLTLLALPAFHFTNLIRGSLIIPAVLRVSKLGNETLSVSLLFKVLKTKKDGFVAPLIKMLLSLLATIFIMIACYLIFNPTNQLKTPYITIVVMLPSLLLALYVILLSKNFFKNAFYEASVITENLKGSKATYRSNSLAQVFNNNKTTIYKGLNVIFIDLLFLSSSLVWVGNKVLTNKPSDIDLIMVFLAATVGFYAIALLFAILGPLLSIIYALFYLKARQSTGETLDEIFDKYEESISK